MKICDRCAPKIVPSAETFVMSIEGSEIELCGNCTAEVLQFIHNPPKPEKKGFFGVGGSKKNSARAEA